MDKTVNASTDCTSNRRSPSSHRNCKRCTKESYHAGSYDCKSSKTLENQSPTKRSQDIDVSFGTSSVDQLYDKVSNTKQKTKTFSLTESGPLKAPKISQGKRSISNVRLENSVLSDCTDQIGKPKFAKSIVGRLGWMKPSIKESNPATSAKSTEEAINKSTASNSHGRKRRTKASSTESDALKAPKVSQDQSPKKRSSNQNTSFGSSFSGDQFCDPHLDPNSNFYDDSGGGLDDANIGLDHDGRAGFHPSLGLNDHLETEKANAQSITSCCLQLSDGIQVPLKVEMCLLDDALEAIAKSADNKNIVTGATEIRLLDGATEFDEQSIFAQLDDGFAVIGQYVTSSKVKTSRKSPKIYRAICILPKDPFVVLFEVRYNDDKTKALYSMLNSNRGIAKSVIDLGTGSQIVLVRPALRRMRTPEGCLVSSDSERVNSIFRNGQTMTKQLSSGRTNRSRQRSEQSILFNSDLIKTVQLDEKDLADNLNFTISKNRQSRTGIRRGGNFVDASDLNASSKPHYDMANLRNLVVANIETVGHRSLTALEFAEIYERVIEEQNLDDAQKDALAAILCMDLQWRIRDVSPEPVRVKFAAVDLDSCAAQGTFLSDFRKKNSNINDQEVEALHRWGLWQSAEVVVDACDRQNVLNGLLQIRTFLRFWTQKIIIAIAGSDENFKTSYMPMCTTFSREDIFTRPGKWMTAMKARYRKKKSHWLPAGDKAFAGSVLQVAIRFGNRKEGITLYCI